MSWSATGSERFAQITKLPLPHNALLLLKEINASSDRRCGRPFPSFLPLLHPSLHCHSSRLSVFASLRTKSSRSPAVVILW
ncbi:hypothetical protein AOLI_G00177280 [Acnodon oligacanthus]